MQCSDLASLQQSFHPGLPPPTPPQMAPAQAQPQVPAHLGPQFLQAGLHMFGRPDLSPHIKQALLSAWQLPPLPSDTPGMAALQPHGMHSLRGPPTPLAGQLRAARAPLFPHAGLEAELLHSCGAQGGAPYPQDPLPEAGPLVPDLLGNTGCATRAGQASQLGPPAPAPGLQLPRSSAPTSLQSLSATPNTPAHASEAHAPALGGAPCCEAGSCTHIPAAAQVPVVSASQSLSLGPGGCRCVHAAAWMELASSSCAVSKHPCLDLPAGCSSCPVAACLPGSCTGRPQPSPVADQGGVAQSGAVTDIGVVPLSTPPFRRDSSHDLFGLASEELDMLLTSTSTWGAM